MHITPSEIQQALNEADIEGLLSEGASRDEYLAEAHSIAERISLNERNDVPAEELISIVSQVWDRYFGPFSATELEARATGFRRVASALQKMHSVAAS